MSRGLAKYSEVNFDRIAFPAVIPETLNGIDAQPSTSSWSVTLVQDQLKSPVLNVRVAQHAIWLTPVVSLCVQPNLIDLYFHVTLKQQVAHSLKCPLVI